MSERSCPTCGKIYQIHQSSHRQSLKAFYGHTQRCKTASPRQSAAPVLLTPISPHQRAAAVATLLLQHGLAILLLQQCLVLHLSWSGEPSSFNGRGVHAEKESLLPQAPSTAP